MWDSTSTVETIIMIVALIVGPAVGGYGIGTLAAKWDNQALRSRYAIISGVGVAAIIGGILFVQEMPNPTIENGETFASVMGTYGYQVTPTDVIIKPYETVYFDATTGTNAAVTCRAETNTGPDTMVVECGQLTPVIP